MSKDAGSQLADNDLGYLELVAVLFHLTPSILSSATAGKLNLPRTVTLSSPAFPTRWQEVNYKQPISATINVAYLLYLTLQLSTVGVNLNFRA